MAVYFVYRCHYGAPSEKHVRRFEYDTVLDWAKAVFRQLDREQGFKYSEELLGGLDVYSFGSMFITDEDHPPVAPPKTMADVKRWFGRMYVGEEAHGPHHIQILTDDDEIEMAVYVFDDHYRAAKPGKADFLLLDGWELPSEFAARKPVPQLPKTGAIKPAGDGTGRVYAASLFASDSANLTDLCPASHIDGIRLPDLAKFLLLHRDEDALDFGLREVRDNLQALLRKRKGDDVGFRAAIRKSPEEVLSWAAYSDWLGDRDMPVAGLYLLDQALRAKDFSDARKNRNPKLDCVKVSDHAAQASKHEGRWPDEPFMWFSPNDTFAQFIYFDDRWAAAHPTLAAGILTFASRWDVLS